MLPSVERLIMSGENKTFIGGEDYLKQKGIEVVVWQNVECEELMKKFIREKPDDWYEDIGEQK
jgi:creatinine deaminase